MNIAPQVLTLMGTLLGILLGWWLRERSERSQRRLEGLNNKISAFKEFKRELDNGLPGVSDGALESVLLGDPQFRKTALVRLFGLRNELFPDLDGSLIKLVDDELAPLYERPKRGQYELPDYNVNAFIRVVEQLRSRVNELESEYDNEYKKYFD